MSLGERDEIIQKLNTAFNMVCDEVDTVKRKLKLNSFFYRLIHCFIIVKYSTSYASILILTFILGHPTCHTLFTQN